VGEPGFATPPHIVEAACQALHDGFTKYSPNPGYLDLREAIAEKIERVNGYRVDPADEVFVTVGAMQALALTFMCGIDPGDEVLVTDPSYTNFEATITLAGGAWSSCPQIPSAGYLPHVEDLAAAVTPRTRAILVNSPANPTGAVYPRDLLHAIADICLRHDLPLISTRRTVGSPTATSERSALRRSPRPPRPHGVHLFLLQGIRDDRLAHRLPHGASLHAAGHGALFREAMASCVNSATQRARSRASRAAGLCRDDATGLRTASEPGRRAARPNPRRALPEARRRVLRVLDVRAVTRDTATLAERLLFDHRVVVSPGEAFGPQSGGFLRLSYATSDEDLAEGLTRLESGLGAARRG
jgi:aspartate/methionine/tyrosine aminotransferase